MTIALDIPRISTAPLSRLARIFGNLVEGAAAAWQDALQVAILRRVDPETLEDIGLSAEHVRFEWQDFASDHPSLVVPPSNFNGTPRR